MRQRVWRFKFIVQALAVIILCVPAGALAGEAPKSKPLDLTTSPLPINLETPPGKSVTTELKVKQSTGETARLKVSLLKFTAFGEEGKPRLLDREPGDTYFDWVKFDKPEFNAPNDVWQTVKMTVNVPKVGAAFGYYYAVVFTRVGDEDDGGGKASAIVGGSAVMVLLNVVVPGAKRSLSLESFSVRHRVVEFLPTKFNVKFKNTGNVHLVPTGNIFLMQGSKQVGSVLLNEQHGNILPGTKRVYDVDWADGYPTYDQYFENGKVKTDKNNHVVYHVNWDLKGKNPLTRLRMGRYTAHVFAVYDDGVRDVPLESEISFWVIPWRILLALLVVLLLVGLGIWAVTRGVWKGTRRQMRRRRRR